MTHAIRKIALGGMLAAFAAAPAFAQGPTPEGTVITNRATATYTDANNNTYAPLSAEVAVTVGFLAGLDLKTATLTLNPTAPSTGNTAVFTIDNNSNGTDQFSLGATAPAGITITGYMVGGITYATLAELNAALAGMNVNAGSSIQVTVVYSVADDAGGSDFVLAVTATSVRSNTTTDSQNITISPLLVGQVNVTPATALEERLPSNATPYSYVFTITNGGNARETFNLSALSSDPSVVGVALPFTTIDLAPGASRTVTLTYTVADVAAGTVATITLSATAQSNAENTDNAKVDVRVIRPAVTMTKQAYRSGGTVQITGSDRVLPNEVIWYKIAVTNGGTAPATQVRIVDQLPAEVAYEGANGDEAANWSISLAGNTVTANFIGSMAGSTTRFIWVQARVR